MRLVVQHSSMQYDDPKTDKQKAAVAVFSYGADLIGLTECGSGQNPTGQRMLRQAAIDAGYWVIFPGYEGGLAVRAGVFQSIVHGYRGPLIKGQPGRYPNEGLMWWRLRLPQIGTLVFASGHWAPQDADPHVHELNDQMSDVVARFLLRRSFRNLVLFTGDTNVNDRYDTLFPRHPKIQTVWDQKEQYPKTHGAAGTIDVIGNVRTPRLRLLSTSVLPLSTSDHHWIQATYEALA